MRSRADGAGELGGVGRERAHVRSRHSLPRSRNAVCDVWYITSCTSEEPSKRTEGRATMRTQEFLTKWISRSRCASPAPATGRALERLAALDSQRAPAGRPAGRRGRRRAPRRRRASTAARRSPTRSARPRDVVALLRERVAQIGDRPRSAPPRLRPAPRPRRLADTANAPPTRGRHRPRTRHPRSAVGVAAALHPRRRLR